MISLVVPNLNEGPYLRQFLQSLVYQLYVKDDFSIAKNLEFELILVDGGSTDNSLDICEKFLGQFPIKILVDETPNIGHIRNVGSRHARGEIILHTSSDVILEPWFLFCVAGEFQDPRLVSLTGRTKPISSSALSHLAYQGFDLLRWACSKLPGSLRKYRPGGNFLAIRRKFFEQLGGFPAVAINEDGLLGQKIEEALLTPRYAWAHTKFDLRLCVHHHVKRFEVKGGLKSVFFYLYVLGNMFPLLRPLLKGLEARSAATFSSRSDLKSVSRRARANVVSQ